MVQYQRGYEAAARVLTTVDSMLDTLINGTGLTR
jgi:flagellar hook-associated protein 1 FlgK